MLLRNYWLYFLAGTLLLGTVGTLVDQRIRESRSGARWVEHTHQVLEAIKGLESRLNNAESEQRAYVLLGEGGALAHYYERISGLERDLDQLQALVADAPQQTERMQILRQTVEARRERLDRVIATRQQHGMPAAVEQIATGIGSALMAQIRDTLNAMEAHERQVLEQRAGATEAHGAVLRWMVPGIGSLAIALLGVAVASASAESRRRRRAESALQQTHAQLQQSLHLVHARAERRQHLHELGELLQSCQSLTELGQVVRHWMHRHGSGHAGALYLSDPPGNRLQLAVAWGQAPLPDASGFEANQCWALRRAQIHHASAHAGLPCPHVQAQTSSTCLPLSAQGQTHGVLHCLGTQDTAQDPLQLETFDLLGTQLGLAIANLRLRDVLHQQSQRDALTGLYNRRHLESVLHGDIGTDRNVYIALLDVDHFKRCNDTYGHDAGDAVLRALGALLASQCQGGDLACRLGGEEFVLVLDVADPATMNERCAQVLSALRGLRVPVRDLTLEHITASIGVAFAPRHGRTLGAVLKHADLALYAAKQHGRDRIEWAVLDHEPKAAGTAAA